MHLRVCEISPAGVEQFEVVTGEDTRGIFNCFCFLDLSICGETPMTRAGVKLSPDCAVTVAILQSTL